MKIDKLKKHLSSIDKISEKLKLDLKPIQTDFAKFIGKKKQYINSFCLGKRQVSNKELLFLLEQYEIFKTVKENKMTVIEGAKLKHEKINPLLTADEAYIIKYCKIFYEIIYTELKKDVNLIFYLDRKDCRVIVYFTKGDKSKEINFVKNEIKNQNALILKKENLFKINWSEYVAILDAKQFLGTYQK